MYFYIDTAKGTRIDHGKYRQAFMSDKKDFKTIKKGDKCLVFTNGTIGKGCRSYNYGRDIAIETLERLLFELKQGEIVTGDNIIQFQANDHNSDDCITINDNEDEYFDADEIPF